jgi:phosphoglycerate dehydrogenase-like enzyme
MYPSDRSLNVLVTYRSHRLGEPLLQRIRNVSPQIKVMYSSGSREDVQLLPSADVLFCTQRAEVFFYAERGVVQFLTKARRLRWVQLLSAGYDRLAGSQLFESEIIVTNSVGIHATPIGEFVLCSMVALSRHLHQVLRTEDAGRLWQSFAFVGRELRGKTVGIIGYGSIGREIARLARCFGMRVIGIRKRPGMVRRLRYIPDELKATDACREDDDVEIRSPQDLEWLLAQSDFVVLSLPLTSETEHVIGESELRIMKPSSYLINSARGGLVDEQALARALREGWIAGAALDVFETEPLSTSSPLYSLPNVIVTPHMSGHTARLWERCVDVFCENLKRFLGGQPLLNQIHPGPHETRP